MKYIEVAGTTFKPSVLGIGCSKIAALSIDRAEVIAMLNEAIEGGVKFLIPRTTTSTATVRNYSVKSSAIAVIN